MKARVHFLRKTFLLALSVFVCSMLAVTGYTLWLLRAEAISRGFAISAMHSQSVEEFFTENLHVTELIAANTLAQTQQAQGGRQLQALFAATLSRSPFLRSMSLLDEKGQITVSSNPANVGLSISTDEFLPLTQRVTQNLRLGEAWAGRDFANGRMANAQYPVAMDELSFLPVIQTMESAGRTLTLLLAFNTDYFVNRIYLQLDDGEGSVEVLRYDGSLLISSDPEKLQASRQDYVLQELKLSEKEFGHLEQTPDQKRKALTTYRASRLYPFVVVTHVDREYALRQWVRQAKTLLGVVGLVLASITWLAIAYYRRQIQLAVQRAESERLQRINATVFDFSPEAILVTDIDASILSVNSAFTQVTGYEASEILGRPLRELLAQDSASAFAELVAAWDAPGRNGAAAGEASIEVRLLCKDGSLMWTEILSTPERDAWGHIVGYHRICRNISERKQMEDQVRQLAFYDPLTLLPNRRLFNDRLSQALAAGRRIGAVGALFFLDLDNFKPLNDTHGHAVGDLLLVEVATRMRNSVRETDTVGRFGGDEFVVLLAALGSEYAEAYAQATVIAEKLRSALSVVYRLVVVDQGGQERIVEHRCSASIGVVLFSGEDCVGDILKRADTAMYQAKDEGGNRVCFYAP